VIELVSKARKHALAHKKDKLEDERVAKRRCLLEITNNSSHSSSNTEEVTMGGSDGCNEIDGEQWR
jgi:heat shock protein HslJ